MKHHLPQKEKYPTNLHYILAALIPYTESNLKLVFKPSAFFDDLDRVGKLKKHQSKSAYYSAVRKNLIKMDDKNMPKLTEKGRRKIQPFKAKVIKNGNLLVGFDIPEDERSKRRHLRTLLKELSFRQVQKSLWSSDKDHRDYLKSEIRQFKLEKYVIVFEAKKIKI